MVASYQTHMGRMLVLLNTLSRCSRWILKADSAVAKLKDGKIAGISNVSMELPKAEGEAMIHRLDSVLTVVWHSGTIPLDWK